MGEIWQKDVFVASTREDDPPFAPLVRCFQAREDDPLANVVSVLEEDETAIPPRRRTTAKSQRTRMILLV